MRGQSQAIVFDVFNTLICNPTEHWIATFHKIVHSLSLSTDGTTLWREWKAFELAFRHNRVSLDCPSKNPPFRTYFEVWMDCFESAFEYLNICGDTKVATDLVVASMQERDIFPDVRAILPTIQAKWCTAILSNADDRYLMPALENNNLIFKTIISSERAKAYKPHPSTFQQVLTKLNMAAEEVVYIGDNPLEDIVGAKRAGMRAIWVNRNHDDWDSRYPPPDTQINSFVNLPSILME